MNSVTISPKYQVVIPKSVRQIIKIVPGQKMQVIAYENRVVLIPIRPIEEAQGWLEGIDTNVEREREDRV